VTDLQKVGADPAIKIVFEEDVDTRILEDEVLYRVAYVRYIKYPMLVRIWVRGGGTSTYSSRSAP